MVLQWGDHGLIFFFFLNQSIKQAEFLLFKRDILILNIFFLFFFLEEEKEGVQH